MQNKQFVYRGLEYERIGAFTQRLQTEFPTAQILTNNSPPDNSILTAPEQYIQISNVRPVGDAQALKTAMVPVPEKIARFYEVSTGTGGVVGLCQTGNLPITSYYEITLFKKGEGEVHKSNARAARTLMLYHTKTWPAGIIITDKCQTAPHCLLIGPFGSYENNLKNVLDVIFHFRD